MELQGWREAARAGPLAARAPDAMDRCGVPRRGTP
jgi:hypothetical protein